MTKRLRLVKVVVQPVFVLDDGDTIQEMPHPPIEIPAADWPIYSGERFPREVAEWQERLNSEPASNGDSAITATGDKDGRFKR
jgi:hypothetical protein